MSLHKTKEKGFTLLFASLVVSLILSIGLAIANITLTQLVLSSAGRASQVAFYNADSGIECALYYEFNMSRDDGEAFFASDGTSAPDKDIECSGGIAEIGDIEDTGATTTTTFYINRASPSCVKGDPAFTVRVHRSPIDDVATNVFIESRGYDTCDPTNPRRVERGLFVRFVD